MEIKKIITFIFLSFILSGCSSTPVLIIESYNNVSLNITNISINDTLISLNSTYSSIKIEDLISSVNNTSGINLSYYAGFGLNLNASNYFSINTSLIQTRVNGTCNPGESIRVINLDGSVECEIDSTGSTDLSNYYTKTESNYLYNVSPINTTINYNNGSVSNIYAYLNNGLTKNTTIIYNSSGIITSIIKNVSGVITITNLTYDAGGNVILITNN